MRHIRQRNAIDCGLAVAAMLADCSYARARQADPFPTKRIGLSVADFLTCIRRCAPNKSWSVIKPKTKTSLTKWTLPKRCALIIREKNRRYGHWIAIDNHIIHDPGLSLPVAMADYDRRNWDVIRIVHEK